GIAPKVVLPEGGWRFQGEEKVREELKSRYGIAVSTDIIPFGYTLRKSPGGARTVAVFGSGIGRMWFLKVLVEHPEISTLEKAVHEALEGWGSYGVLGVYAADAKGGFRLSGNWRDMQGNDTWGKAALSDPPKPFSSCLACRGWACPVEPVACFSDLNGNGREETHLLRRGSNFVGFTMLEVDSSGKMSVLYDQSESGGVWKKHKGEWILAGSTTCEWGFFCGEGEASLGNPNCSPGSAYRFDPKSGVLKNNPALTASLYPVETRVAPERCGAVEPGGVLVLEGDKFVRYMPK
ncbi:hypothetical protein ACFL2T_01090, partial [Elusimicrobiota bacterium]